MAKTYKMHARTMGYNTQCGMVFWTADDPNITDDANVVTCKICLRVLASNAHHRARAN